MNKSDITRNHYLQVKVKRETRIKIAELANLSHRPVADIIRGSLYFGIPMLEMMLQMEGKLNELIKALQPSFDGESGQPLKDLCDKFK